jgi:Zn-finger nucleic acid-binding protein
MAPDGRTLHCSSCGAPFEDASRFCSHCGSETTLEERRLDAICVHCGARAASDASFCTQCGRALGRQETKLGKDPGGCPRCGAALRERDLAATTVVECSSCGGLWLAPAVFDQLCQDADASANATRELARSALPRAPFTETKVAYLPCPICKDLMVRKNFGGASGVILDVCRNDGIWLDRGELERVLAFVRAGGLVEARRREIRRLDDETRAAKERREAAGTGAGIGEAFVMGYDLPSGVRSESFFSHLCDLLFSR